VGERDALGIDDRWLFHHPTPLLWQSSGDVCLCMENCVGREISVTVVGTHILYSTVRRAMRLTEGSPYNLACHKGIFRDDLPELQILQNSIPFRCLKAEVPNFKQLFKNCLHLDIIITDNPNRAPSNCRLLPREREDPGRRTTPPPTVERDSGKWKSNLRISWNLQEGSGRSSSCPPPFCVLLVACACCGGDWSSSWSHCCWS